MNGSVWTHTSKSQTTSADSAHSAASNSDSKSVQLQVHIRPSIAGSDGHRRKVARRCHLIEAAQINRDAFFCICCSSKRSVTGWSQPTSTIFPPSSVIPSTSHSKITFARKCGATNIQQRDRKGYIETGCRCYDTSRAYILFLYAPIRGQRLVVRDAPEFGDLVGKCELKGTTLNVRSTRSALPYGLW